MSRRRQHTPGPRNINPEPARCVCQPGPDAHHEHAKPGRVAAKHFDPRCPHWDRSVVVTVSKRILQNPAKVKRLIERLNLDVADDT
jgi:hypothetical protein